MFLAASWLSHSTFFPSNVSSITLFGNICTTTLCKKGTWPSCQQKGYNTQAPHTFPCNRSHYHQCLGWVDHSVDSKESEKSQSRAGWVQQFQLLDIGVYTDSIHRAFCPKSIQLCQMICLCPLCLAATYYNILLICHPTRTQYMSSLA